MISKYKFLITSYLKGKSIINEFVLNNISYEYVVKMIYNDLRNFKTLYDKDITTETISECIINNLKQFENNAESINVEYHIYITIRDTSTDICVTNKNYDYIYEFKNVIHNDNYAKNCVTDFCKRGIYPNIITINEYYEDLVDRHNIRINEQSYHDSLCYERDYAQILKIKKLSEKLVSLCNKELISLSDKYTK